MATVHVTRDAQGVINAILSAPNSESEPLDETHTDVLGFYEPPLTVDDVSVEAERRIAAGTMINGVRFRCDDKSTNRLKGMADRFKREEDAGRTYSATFRTQSGQEMTITTSAAAYAVLDAAVDHVSLMLGCSATLQAMSTIPADYATNETYWT